MPTPEEPTILQRAIANQHDIKSRLSVLEGLFDEFAILKQRFYCTQDEIYGKYLDGACHPKPILTRLAAVEAKLASACPCPGDSYRPAAIQLIAAERYRQIHCEGWTADHDDKQADGELGIAAACYAVPRALRLLWLDGLYPALWPFARHWWKPTPNDRIRELVKAGALIVAEIDRLQRKEQLCQP